MYRELYGPQNFRKDQKPDPENKAGILQNPPQENFIEEKNTIKTVVDIEEKLQKADFSTKDPQA